MTGCYFEIVCLVVGVEVASPVELEYALRLGFEPKDIVFDRSPLRAYSMQI